MNPIDAHKRLVSSLPVRTHKMRNDDPAERHYSPRITKWQSKALRARVLANSKDGLKPKQIAEKMEIPVTAVYNYLRVR